MTYSDFYIAKTLWKGSAIPYTEWNGENSKSNIEIQTLLNDPKFESILSLVNLWAMSSNQSATELKKRATAIIDMINMELLE